MTPPRESIFSASLRSFFTSFAAILGVLVGLIIILFIVIGLSGSPLTEEETETSIAADANGSRELLSPSTPAILRINIHGVIGEPLLDSQSIENILLDSRSGMLAGGRVKGILLHMNTPGGTVTDSDDAYRLIKAYKEKYKVPVYAYIEGMCASGGVYISSACDRIYATPSSIVGSVGVILGPTFNFTGTMDKIGVQALTITEGKDKDALNPFRPWKSDEDASLRAITSGLYTRFVDIVTEARPAINREKLVNEYGAHIFLADKAQELGYIDDANANYGKALSELVVAAGIKEKEPYQVFELQPKMNFFSSLTHGKFAFLTGKVKHVLQIGPNMTSEMSGKLLYLYQPLTDSSQ
ncbi:MAG: S49 family peptidase [Chlamydiales bacterium]|nr:S49 family peptidase [Chlamydiales bacterium]